MWVRLSERMLHNRKINCGSKNATHTLSVACPFPPVELKVVTLSIEHYRQNLFQSPCVQNLKDRCRDARSFFRDVPHYGGAALFRKPVQSKNISSERFNLLEYTQSIRELGPTQREL